MTDECKAHALYKECGSWRAATFAALEAHELDKARHAAEMREQAERFSEAAKAVCGVFDDLIHADSDGGAALAKLRPFILAPVDQLVEAIKSSAWASDVHAESMAAELRAALDARGLAIVKKEAVNG